MSQLSHASIRLAQKAREAREDRGLTQAQLADLTQLSRRTVQRFEAAEVDLGFGDAAKVARVLRLPLDRIAKARGPTAKAS